MFNGKKIQRFPRQPNKVFYSYYSAGIVVLVLLLCCPLQQTAAAYDLNGEWTGICDATDISLTLTRNGDAVSGALTAGGSTYEVQGSFDNATLHAEGKAAQRLLAGRCVLDFTVASSAVMNGRIHFTGPLGLRGKSCDLTLSHQQYLFNFSLLMGHVQKPSNIYLFFSVEDAAGQPVTGLREDDFEIYENDRLISRYESSQTIIPNPTLYTMATVLLLDMSGSILESQTLTPLKASAKAFLDSIAGEEGQEVAIYLFDGRESIRQLVGFTKDSRALQSAIDALSKATITGDPGYDISTNLNGAVQQGITVLNEHQSQIAEGALFTGTLVTFTDGTDQAARVSNSAAVESVTAAPHYSFGIGLGGEIDENHLRNLGKDGFAWAENTEELDGAFAKIAATIRSQSGKHYILGYCTPKRSAEHTVTLTAKDHAGALSFAFSADGFQGGCDPLDILQGMQPGDNNQCLLDVQPASVRRGLLRPRTIMLAITSRDMQFNRKSEVAIDGATVLATYYRSPVKLTALVRFPQTVVPGTKDVTVTTDDEKLTCFDIFTVR
jgi:hypothetical protein